MSSIQTRTIHARDNPTDEGVRNRYSENKISTLTMTYFSTFVSFIMTHYQLSTVCRAHNFRHKLLSQPKRRDRSTMADDNTSNKKPRLHSVLKDLFVKNSKKEKDGVTAMDVLQQLLETNVVTEEAVRAAYQTLESSRQLKKEISSPPVTKEAHSPPSYRTRHISLRFYYDGSKYTGLAENIGFPADNSVEKEVFKALIKAKLIESRATSGYSRCGRTDKGVSAVGQVVALQLKSAFHEQASWDEEGTSLLETKDLVNNSRDKLSVWSPMRKKKGDTTDTIVRQHKDLTEYPFDKILNNLLPDDIRILAWSPVSDDFSARFSCMTRTYRYFFVKRQMDLEKIREGLQLMVGIHDFRNFCKMDIEKVYNFERKIHNAKVVETGNDDVCYLEILGQAFLWHQIRCIASILFTVGEGQEPPSIVTELLDVVKCPGKPSYPLAPERPLVLHHCGYPNVEFGYSAHNLWHVYSHLEQQWEDLVLAEARIRNCQSSLSECSVTLEDLTGFAVTRLKFRHRKSRFNDDNSVGDVDHPFGDAKTVLWSDALAWLKESYELMPDPSGAKDSAYSPLLGRAKGTTYEEKVAALALQPTSKRFRKYEDNVFKKRLTKEEDHAFYTHMSKQGGSGV
jgi:tRNA pseudouridine38/39 synthase